jgi:hypothetical protein
MTPTQSNTQAGLLKFIANADLTGKEGYLAKLVDATGTAKIDLAGDGEFAQFVITEGAASGESVEVMPLDPSRNIRVIAGASIAAGTKVASSATGKLAAATTGEHVIGILEEDVVDTQLGRIRPIALGIHHAATAVSLTQTALTDSSGGSANGTVAAITQVANAGSADVGPVKDAIADIVAQLNAARVDIAAIKAVLDAQKITS